MKKNHHSHGVITILVALMLVGVLSVGTVVIEAGRFQAAKLQLTESTASAATSMIAAYDADFYSKYGLYVIETERFVPERAMDYIYMNSDLTPGYDRSNVSTLYAVDSVELTGMYNLTYPSVLKRQILSRAKYHVIPQEYTINVSTMDAFFADLQTKCLKVAAELEPVVNGTAIPGTIADVSPQMKAALTSLYATTATLKTSDPACDITLSTGTTAMLPSVTGTVESEIPIDDVNNINLTLQNANDVLGAPAGSLSYNNGTVTPEVEVNIGADPQLVNELKIVLKDVSTANDVPNNTRRLATEVYRLAQGMNASINALKSTDEENMLLNSYIAEYFSNRNGRITTYTAPEKGVTINASKDNLAFASACVEYVIGGDAAEKINQDKTYSYIQAIYLINNLYNAVTESESFNAHNMYSVAAHLAWANFESALDMELLTVQKVSVPFNKERMLLDVNQAAAVNTAFASRNIPNAMRALGFMDGTAYKIPGENAMPYKDALALALWFVPNTTKLMRVADLMQLEMRYQEQYVDNKSATFLMSEQNTYCRIKCVGRFRSVLPMLSLGTSGVGEVGFQSIKYAGY